MNPGRQYRTFSNRTADRLSVNGKDAGFWDRDLPGFGKLLGHRKIQSTSRYTLLALDSVKASAARIADSLRADLTGEGDLLRPAS